MWAYIREHMFKWRFKSTLYSTINKQIPFSLIERREEEGAAEIFCVRICMPFLVALDLLFLAKCYKKDEGKTGGRGMRRVSENERARENTNKSHPSDEMEENRTPREYIWVFLRHGRCAKEAREKWGEGGEKNEKPIVPDIIFKFRGFLKARRHAENTSICSSFARFLLDKRNFG